MNAFKLIDIPQGLLSSNSFKSTEFVPKAYCRWIIALLMGYYAVDRWPFN